MELLGECFSIFEFWKCLVMFIGCLEFVFWDDLEVFYDYWVVKMGMIFN